MTLTSELIEYGVHYFVHYTIFFYKILSTKHERLKAVVFHSIIPQILISMAHSLRVSILRS